MKEKIAKKMRISGEQSAVSPVIGVILMVAITVILSAVIATFVLGISDSVSDSTPTASFNADFESNSEAEDFVVLQHRSGDRIDAGNIIVTLPDTEGVTVDASTFAGSDDVVSAGDSLTINRTGTTIEQGNRVQIIYDDGETSSILRTFEAPREYQTP